MRAIVQAATTTIPRTTSSVVMDFNPELIDPLTLERIIKDDKSSFDRKTIKTTFGGQKVNRLERVKSLLSEYKKSHMNIGCDIFILAELAVLDDRYMADFIKIMPKKIPYFKKHKRKNAMNP